MFFLGIICFRCLTFLLKLFCFTLKSAEPGKASCCSVNSFINHKSFKSLILPLCKFCLHDHKLGLPRCQFCPDGVCESISGGSSRVRVCYQLTGLIMWDQPHPLRLTSLFEACLILWGHHPLMRPASSYKLASSWEAGLILWDCLSYEAVLIR